MTKTIALVIALCASSIAHAESRAWTAAKKVLPAGLQSVIGANITALHGSQLFDTLWPMLLAQSKGAADGIAKVKDTCGIDLADAIDSMVVGLDADQHASIVVALRKQSRTEADACLNKLAKAGGQKLAISKDGALTKYDDGSEAVYLRWLDKTTLVFTSAPDDKALLGKLSAGGVTSDKPIAAAIAGIKGNATVAMILNQAQDLGPLNAKMSLAYGSAVLAAGTIAVDAHLVVDSAKAATDAAATANAQLTAAKASGQIPQQLDAVVKTVAVKAAGSELVVTGSLAEQDAVSLIKLALTK